MHGIYGGLRLVALLADVYVWYHAKGLKILGEEKEEEDGNDDDGNGDNEKKEQPIDPSHPTDPTPRKISHKHKRSASREIKALFDPAEDAEDELERRKSVEYMAGTIADYSTVH